MADVTYTKLRYIKAKERDLLVAAIERLGFKVEVKEVVLEGASWVCWFTVDDYVEFKSVDLDIGG